MICTLEVLDDQPNWCTRHKMYHRGHYADYALDPGEKGEKFRQWWDRQAGISHRRFFRPLSLVKECQHWLDTENPPEKEGCGACKTWNCSLKGKVKLSHCMGECQDHAKRPRSPLVQVEEPRQPIRFDHTNLFPGVVPGIRFNSTIIESGDDYIYGFRNGWSGSNIYLCRLDKEFKPYGECKQLALGKRGSRVGREDPRLFRLNGKLHLVFTGYEGRITNVLFARINEETLTVEDVFFPKAPGKYGWEKNWMPFDYQGVAHFIYSINPHKILRVEGNKAEWVAETPFTGEWSGGHMRGGAAPVFHDGTWWHFFHGAYDLGGRRRYCTGVYRFSPEPPFEILSYTPDPIDEADLERKHDNWSDVLFIGGAVLKDKTWITSSGVHDRWSELRFYDHETIESQLVPHPLNSRNAA